MKQFKLALLLLVCFSTAISCKKTIQTKMASNMSFKLDNVSKQIYGDQNVFISHYTTEQSLQVIGNMGGTEGISIMVDNYKGIGSYTSDDLIFVYTKDVTDGNPYMGKTGTLKITSVTDNTVKGEFEFSAENNTNQTKVISEGKFEGKILSL